MQARTFLLLFCSLCLGLASQPLHAQERDLPAVHACKRMPLAYLFSTHPPQMRTPQDVADHLRQTANFRIWWIHRHIFALLTMPFKYMGFTGWTNLCAEVYATGRVLHADRSNDGFYTVDLALEDFRVAEKETNLVGPRFIRVEIRPEVRRITHSLPLVGQTIQVAGRLLWDGDGRGFLEIHPREPSDIQIESANVQHASEQHAITAR